jgi:hypothetical protein
MQEIPPCYDGTVVSKGRKGIVCREDPDDGEIVIWSIKVNSAAIASMVHARPGNNRSIASKGSEGVLSGINLGHSKIVIRAIKIYPAAISTPVAGLIADPSRVSPGDDSAITPQGCKSLRCGKNPDYTEIIIGAIKIYAGAVASIEWMAPCDNAAVVSYGRKG